MKKVIDMTPRCPKCNAIVDNFDFQYDFYLSYLTITYGAWCHHCQLTFTITDEYNMKKRRIRLAENNC